MKKIAILLLLLFSLESIAQTYQENLEKYWYYRHRLKEKFMYYNGDASIQGAHHVAENRNNDWEYIRWADGVWWLGHYIGVLAMEYRLLKDNGQDYTETLDELNLAFDTYYRLDYNAEPCFNNIWGNEGTASTNGFFLRDDLDESCSPNFDNFEIKAGYYSCQDGTESNVNSQDQHVMMFLGLNLVDNLVDDSDIQNRTDDIAELVIGSMTWYNFLILQHMWEIRNPVTLGIPDGGSDLEMVSFRWAYAESAGLITDENEHKGYSILNKPQFDIFQGLVWEILQGGPQKFTGYFTMVLSAIIDDGGSYFWPTSDGNSYDWLCEMYENTKAYEGMGEGIGLFPHLAAISEVLHGYDGDNHRSASFYEDGFLNNAPSCGSFNNRDDGTNTSPPWHTMSLFCPWHRNSTGDEGGEYNMLDYMMLYNAYFSTYLYDENQIIPYKLVTGDYPFIEYEIVWDINGYPDTIAVWEYYTCSEPGVFTASNQIEIQATVNNNGGIECISGGSIRMLPDFKVSSGGCFKATINPSIYQDFYYHKTNIDPCNGGTFETIKIKYEMADFPILKSMPQFPDSIWQTEHWLVMDSLFGNSNKNISLNNNQVNTHSTFKVFPNPTNGIFKVNLPDNETIKSFEIVDYTGKIIFSGKNNKEHILKFDLSDYKSGIYFVKVITDSCESWMKVVKY